jgi:hypothetical protein
MSALVAAATGHRTCYTGLSGSDTERCALRSTIELSRQPVASQCWDANPASEAKLLILWWTRRDSNLRPVLLQVSCCLCTCLLMDAAV